VHASFKPYLSFPDLFSGMQGRKHIREEDVLSRVNVRLVGEEERAEYDRLLEERHYLESARLSGQTLRYVAELNREWVGLVCFGAAALHLKSCEKWIGWSHGSVRAGLTSWLTTAD
jgi:hypothetical protein